MIRSLFSQKECPACNSDYSKDPRSYATTAGNNVRYEEWSNDSDLLISSLIVVKCPQCGISFVANYDISDEFISAKSIIEQLQR
jgi:hypothetical protein